MRVIFYLLVVSFLFDEHGLVKYFEKKANYLSFNIFLLLETIGLCIFFYQVLASSLIRKILIFVFPFLVGFWIFEFYKNSRYDILNHFIAAEQTLILFLIINFYYQELAKQNASYAYLTTRFWVVTAFFVYSAGTFFLLLYLPSLEFAEKTKYYVWNYVFIIIRTFLLSIAMFMKNNNKPI